jgi:hypothetical protein
MGDPYPLPQSSPGWGFLAAHPFTMILNIRHLLRMVMRTIRYSQMHPPPTLGGVVRPHYKSVRNSQAPPLNGVHPPHEWVFVEALAET